MKPDLYTKAILTVIALLLAGHLAKDLVHPPDAQAQPGELYDTVLVPTHLSEPKYPVSLKRDPVAVYCPSNVSACLALVRR